MFQFLFGISSFPVMKATNGIKHAIQNIRPQTEISGQSINQGQVSAQDANQKRVSVQSVNKAQISIQSPEQQGVTEISGRHESLEPPAEPETPEQSDGLDPAAIPKFVNQLVKLPVYMPMIKKVKIEPDDDDKEKNEQRRHDDKERHEQKCRDDDKEKYELRHQYLIDICEFEEQILPEGFPKTKVWGYGGLVGDPETAEARYVRSSPGGTFEAVRGTPAIVHWRNILNGKHPFAVDPTLHWANPNEMPMEPRKPWPAFPPGFPEAQFPVPSVTHLHGAEVSSLYDGHPDEWFSSNGKKGPAYSGSMFLYPNSQEPTTLWYHDHTLGMTRLNVYAGLAGFYLLRDPEGCGCEKLDLPEGKYEIPLLIQDRSFKTDGSLVFNEQGLDPEVHPYWVPGFGGNTIVVNGKSWPNLDVERRQYRFRILNGSNARFYNLKMSNGMSFIQIGSDGGYLPEPVELDALLLAPSERADILADFSGTEPGTSIVLLNDAPAPFPDGFAPDENTVGQIMRFTVPAGCAPPVKPPKLPRKLNDIVALIPDTPERILTLNEVMGPNGPVAVLLNGRKWADPVSETPRVGSTEDWVIVNIAIGTHPIHLHLIQFQVLSRQEFKAEEYRTKWEELNGMPGMNGETGGNEAHGMHDGPHEAHEGHPPVVLPVEPYLTGEPVSADKNERGWKDTVKVYPNQVTRIRVRFAPQGIPVCGVRPGENKFPFDPSEGPGYVWHCHILDHEDNEMMRPLKVQL